MAAQYRMPQLVMVAAMLCSLVFGITLTIPEIVFIDDLWTSGIGILLIVGVLLLVCSIGIRTSLVDSHQKEVSTGLALYVLIEFLAGAPLVFIGVYPTFFDTSQRELSMVGIFIFGLVLVIDSILFYRRVFKGTRLRERRQDGPSE